MERIYSTRPENKGGFVLLLMSIIAIVFLVFIICVDGLFLLSLQKVSDIAKIVILFSIIGGWLFYVLDEAIWQLFGKEQCEYNEKGIFVTKYRLIKRRRAIDWDEIKSISTYNPTAVRKVITYLTAAGLPQEKIVIIYKNGRKYKCGVNLNKHQTIDAIDKLNYMKIKLEKNNGSS